MALPLYALCYTLGSAGLARRDMPGLISMRLSDERRKRRLDVARAKNGLESSIKTKRRGIAKEALISALIFFALFLANLVDGDIYLYIGGSISRDKAPFLYWFFQGFHLVLSFMLFRLYSKDRSLLASKS